MSLGPAALCSWLSSDFCLAFLTWLRASRESLCSASFVGTWYGTHQVTSGSSYGQAPRSAFLDMSALGIHQGEMPAFSLAREYC